MITITGQSMNDMMLPASAAPGLPAVSGLEQSDTFARLMEASSSDGRTMPGQGAADMADMAARARETAARFVSLTLVQPVLEQVRESNIITDGPFAPTDVERRFGPMMDAMVADRVTEGAGFPLVDMLAERLMQRAYSASARTQSEPAMEVLDG